MSKVNNLTLKENFSWNFLGSMVYSLSQFLILVLLAKFGSTAMVGLYSIGLAITAPIISFTNLQLRQIQATDSVETRFQFNDYFGLRIVTGFFMLIVTIIAVTISGYNLEKTIIVILVGLSKVFDSYSDVIYGQLQNRERMDYVGKSRIVKGISTIIVMGTILYSSANLLVSLVALNITWLLIFLIYDKKKVKLFVSNTKPYFSLTKFKSLVVIAFPLGLVLMLGSLNTNIPKIVVERTLNEVSLGYFASITYLLATGNIFIQAIGQAATPRLAKLYRSKNTNEFKRVMVILVVIGLCVGTIGTIVSILFGDVILTIIYESSYAKYNDILILVMIASIFTFINSFLGYGITAMRFFRIQPYIGGVTLFITFILATMLIPSIGLKGAAYTLIISSIVRCIINITVLLFSLNYKVHST